MMHTDVAAVEEHCACRRKREKSCIMDRFRTWPAKKLAKKKYTAERLIALCTPAASRHQRRPKISRLLPDHKLQACARLQTDYSVRP